MEVAESAPGERHSRRRTGLNQPAHSDLYREAVGRYPGSDGKALLLVGVLIRDTPPSERDLKARGEALSHRAAGPARVDLIAWYLPVPISGWSALLQESAP